jgi:hypothetical protein
MVAAVTAEVAVMAVEVQDLPGVVMVAEAVKGPAEEVNTNFLTHYKYSNPRRTGGDY